MLRGLKVIGIVLICLFSLELWAASTLHHDLKVNIQPQNNAIEVTDTITLPQNYSSEFIFALHAELVPEAQNQAYQLKRLNKASFGEVSIYRYQVKLPEGENTFTLRYQGKVFHPVSLQGEAHELGMADSQGLISEQGVFLAHGSAWYPLFDESPALSFRLDVTLPHGWKAVSQGDRMTDQQGDTQSKAIWQESTPQEEIYLIAAQFTEYKKTTGPVEALVFLRQPESELAQRFLDVTSQYIEMYRTLIGPYPYSKFAVIENFWETGFGMPSFTLLGPKVIRLPFITYTSYPHEILHNWWGNGVYVDYSQGNWSEGLTAYLADHLIQEQRQKGAGARRAALQNYTDFVREQKELPLSDFRSKHSASSEAIGYGKAQMFFHMLRLKIGDQAFIKGLHRLYQRYKFKEAGYAELEKIFSDVSDKDLRNFFNQWISRTGSPELKVSESNIVQDGSEWVLRFALRQSQQGDAYELTIPIAVTMQGEAETFQQILHMGSIEKSFELRLPAQPLRMDIDPEFDIFRRLDRAEIPPALSQAFGDVRGVIVLPSAASASLLEAYQAFSQSWAQSGKMHVILDSEIDVLPENASVWIIGWNNKFANLFQQQMSDFMVRESATTLRVNGKSLSAEEHAVVFVGRNKDHPQHARVWIASANPNAVPGLVRKLPHYRKYSYLAFTGDEPTNVLKAQWPVLDSPMTVLFGDKMVARAGLAKRFALAELPPAFDTEQLMADIRTLTAPEMAGRGLGTPGLDHAAQAIADMFQAAGLKPGNLKEQSYFQEWTQAVEGLGEEVKLKNVIGYLPGSNPKYQGESVVITAHYDHLGDGWPNAREEFKGHIHHGADDNASGVAVMTALARMAAKNWRPERSIVFIAFTAEESGLIGSRYYAEHPMPFSLDKMLGVINLDTVGRLGDSPITVFGTGSASEWVHIFRGVGFVTGIDIQSVPNDLGTSDQKSFLDKGVPAVQFFGSLHQDFHSPRDTVDKLDLSGMVKMFMVLKEAADYLVKRPSALTVTLDNVKSDGPIISGRPKGRKVSLGTIPDFAYQGQGVRISDVVSSSPAELAGLKKRDVIVQANGKQVEDLSGFSKILRGLSPGDMIEIVYIREGQKNSVKLQVKER